MKNSVYVAIPLLLMAAVLTTQAQCIVVGFEEIDAVPDLPQAAIDRIQPLKWYFTHASVGGNMMDGVTDLHGADPNHYPYTRTGDDTSPPVNTACATIYDYNRGNPGWLLKFDGFTVCVSNGWRHPKVNLVLDKLCYIDQTADLNYYIHSMTNLEATFPDTVFVYATMPITTGEDYNNYLRNVYNDGLRTWVTNNNRVLFDIADIEAHDTNGTEYTFVYNTKTCQKLYSGFTTDGGHLNDAGNVGRQQVAKGFYALAAALFDVDRDGDGLTDGEELIAGSCPTSTQSVFEVTAARGGSYPDMTFTWASSSSRVYNLYRTSDLTNSPWPGLLVTNLAATPPLNTVTDVLESGGPWFYKLSVRQQ